MEQNKLLTTKKITYCAIFTALITIGAFIQIPVPFMDYFTLQFFIVLLAGILLGSKLGALAVLLYVVIGLLGLPIFAAGGGLAYIVRPSFGYLIGLSLTMAKVGDATYPYKYRKIIRVLKNYSVYSAGGRLSLPLRHNIQERQNHVRKKDTRRFGLPPAADHEPD